MSYETRSRWLPLILLVSCGRQQPDRIGDPDLQVNSAALCAVGGQPITREMFTFRTDDDLVQFAALRDGVGIGGTQTIKWDVFAPQLVYVKRYQIELYLEHSRLLTVCDDDGNLAGSARKYEWQIPEDLQDESNYRLRLAAWDYSGRESETFSPPFRPFLACCCRCLL